MKSLVIVESPTKTKTIRKFLPKGVVVDASMGHIRDLPSSAKEIPASEKKKPWASLGIDVDHDFSPLYVIPSDKKKVVKKLKDLLKESDELILATDEDREGEAISWHLVEVLKPTVPVRRMVFREITEEAIQRALGQTREIDMNLVHAQETRRILDRLAGYTISPLLWKKISPGLSAGRVQSVAVEFIVQRERERMRFKSGSYFDLRAQVNAGSSATTFSADLTHVDKKRVASGKDFDEQTGNLRAPDQVALLDEAAAKSLRSALEKATWSVADLDVSIQSRTPAPPFITSTLQQEANRKFGFSARDTMSIAQKLYENGLITYMRTDSPALSDQATTAAREGILEKYGQEYLSSKPRVYSSKEKGAQEAHEAIRPSGSRFVTPEKSGLSGREFKLYDLIWKRTIATQMAEAKLEFTTATILAETSEQSAQFRASGKRILFPGFFRAYVEGSDDPEASIEDQEQPLPALQKSQKLTLEEIEAIGHETKPPARYTEATLVRELEKRGIGRPSTYAAIISTIQDRGYVRTEGRALVPTFTAFAVSELLERHFPDLVNSDFTSGLEDKLDGIAAGKVDPLHYLKEYYLGDSGLREEVARQEDKINPGEARKIDLPIDGLENVEILIGRFGPYIRSVRNQEEVSTSIPEQLSPADLTPEKIERLLTQGQDGDKPLGNDPETGLPVYLLTGRYGPYVQLGDQESASQVAESSESSTAPVADGKKGGKKVGKKTAAKKPKRVSLPKGLSPEEVDLEKALRLLELPRLLGNHPETGKEIRAGIGRFGPFVVHDGTFKSLTKEDHVLDVTYERALELLSQAKSSRGSSVIVELGEDPSSGKPVRVMEGRYGPYVKVGTKNASLPKSLHPESVTLAQALELIDKKKGTGKKK